MKKLDAIEEAISKGISYRKIANLYWFDFDELEPIERGRAVKSPIINQRGQTKCLRSGRLNVDLYGAPFRDIVSNLMVRNGQNAKRCFQCGIVTDCVIHHTRYKGATVKDLQYICQRCNLHPRNVGLQ